MWIAELSTRHYDFVLIAKTEEKCMIAMKSEWRKYCKKRGIPNSWNEIQDDLNYYPVDEGKLYCECERV
jgi:hypothetical protein